MFTLMSKQFMICAICWNDNWTGCCSFVPICSYYVLIFTMYFVYVFAILYMNACVYCMYVLFIMRLYIRINSLVVYMYECIYSSFICVCRYNVYKAIWICMFAFIISYIYALIYTCMLACVSSSDDTAFRPNMSGIHRILYSDSLHIHHLQNTALMNTYIHHP